MFYMDVTAGLIFWLAVKHHTLQHATLPFLYPDDLLTCSPSDCRRGYERITLGIISSTTWDENESFFP